MGSKQYKVLPFDIFNYSFLIVFSISIIVPFWTLIVTSFTHPNEALSMGLKLLPSEWYTGSYLYLISNSNNLIAYGNTIFRTVVGTIMMIICTLFAAYPLSKKELPFRTQMTILYLIPMFFSGGLIPYYLLIRNIGLYNSIWVYVLPSAVNIFNILITRNFIMAIDKALEESAYIDGAGQITILYKIISPVCKPVIATISLFTAVMHWNSWFDSLIFIRDENKIVMQLVLQRMVLQAAFLEEHLLSNFRRETGMQVSTITLRAATAVTIIIPIILLYPFLQKYFVKGIMIGSLKG